MIRAGRAGLRVIEIPIRLAREAAAGDQPRQARAERPPRHGEADVRDPVRRQAVRRAAVSIDLDGIGCYYRIHALGPHPVELEHAILERALPRAAALFGSAAST